MKMGKIIYPNEETVDTDETWGLQSTSIIHKHYVKVYEDEKFEK